MKVALVNPPWCFDGSIYFGCRDPHLPLELGYTKALLEERGHEVRVLDAFLDGWDLGTLRRVVEDFAPDFTVLVTAPSYLFWRCAPPELRVPMETARALEGVGGTLIGCGPHASTTPKATLRKLGVDVVVLGECEDIVVKLVETDRSKWDTLTSIAFGPPGEERALGTPHGVDLKILKPLRWERPVLTKHRHHHHRFDREPDGPGAEVEATRGCPFHCTFCAKDNFRDKFRKRPVDVVLDEIDGLVAQGVTYVYFVDEIFMPDEELLQGLVKRPISFGVQMRIDLWSKPQLDLLGEAGCVSIEAGVESISVQGRSLLAKRCRMSTEQLADLLLHAKQKVPFVQANLLDCQEDDPKAVRAFRDELRSRGVWANDPVPLFPYPGSPEYTKRWGVPDDTAWERAVDHYLALFEHFSDIQETRPKTLAELEGP